MDHYHRSHHQHQHQQPRYADASWVMEVDCSCLECKHRIWESISSIVGVYNLDFDSTEGIVKISGEVDPNVLMQAMRRCNRHARVLRARITHPELTNKHSHHHHHRAICNNVGNYPAIEYGRCNHGSSGGALLEGGGCSSGYDYNTNHRPSIYSCLNHGLAVEQHYRPYGPRTDSLYGRSYPSMDYYDRMRAEENWCTIM